MVPYEIYKMIHLGSLMLLFTGFTVSLIGQKQIKLFKILTGVATLLVFVTGMGLMARIGIGHGNPWPLWIKLKFTIFGIIGIGVPIVIKRMKSLYTPTYWLMIVIFVIASGLVNYKP